MDLLDFLALPLWANGLLFAAGAGVVWLAGTRVSRYVDAIAARTRLGTAFAGMVLLGGITSLPEIATTITASLAGNAPLAVSNIMGGIAMQVAILALADAATRRDALAVAAASSDLLLQGVFLVLVLVLAATAIGVGDVAVLGIGAWTAALFALVLLGLYLVRRHEASPRWAPVEGRERPGQGGAGDEDAAPAEERPERALAWGRLVAYTVAAGGAVLVAGFFVTRAAEALAEQTGIGPDLAGAVLLAISTSLPEVSTTLGAVRLGEHRLAVSNIFGTNLFDVAILLLADAVYAGPPVLDEVGAFAQVGALLGAVLTAVYVAGLIERRTRTVFGMGLASLVVLGLYAGGLALLVGLR